MLLSLVNSFKSLNPDKNTHIAGNIATIAK